MPVYTLTILFAAAIVVWTYHHDTQEKEPWWAVLVAIAVGFRPNGNREHYPRLVILCLALSTTMHFGWDTVAYSHSSGLLAHVLPMWIMLMMMIVWKWFCTLAKQRSQALFPVPA